MDQLIEKQRWCATGAVPTNPRYGFDGRRPQEPLAKRQDEFPSFSRASSSSRAATSLGWTGARGSRVSRS